MELSQCANAETMKRVEEALKTNEGEKLTQSEKWPLLLRGLEDMNIKTLNYTPTACGYSPHSRPLAEHMKYGVIKLDKPCNPSSHEIVAWVKKIAKCAKTGHSGTLDPMVSGCLPVCLNRATRVAKTQQNAGKEYVAVVQFKERVKKEKFIEALKEFTGPLLQRPPEQCAVKRVLRVRSVYSNVFVDFDEEKRIGMFRTECEAGTYIRTLCVHLGLRLGVEAEMVDLRRVRSGTVTEEGLVSMHDVLDSMYLYEKEGNEKYLRAVVLPLETLLVGYARIIVKDSAINSLCYGGQLTTKGVLRYDSFDHKEVVVLVSPKGEAVALAVALVTASQLSMMDYGYVSRTKRVIMDKDTYAKQWGLGPEKNRAKEERESSTEMENEREKEGRKTDEKPEKWERGLPDSEYKKFSAGTVDDSRKYVKFRQNKRKYEQRDGRKKPTYVGRRE